MSRLFRVGGVAVRRDSVSSSARLLFGHLLQGVPLRDRSSRVGQHVAPMAQFATGRVAAEHHVADGVRCADAVVVDNSDDKRDFLKRA